MRHLLHILARPSMRRLWCVMVMCVCMIGQHAEASAMSWGFGQLCMVETLENQPTYSPWLMMTPKEQSAAQLAMLLATYEQRTPPATSPCHEQPEQTPGATCEITTTTLDADVLDSGDVPDTLRASLMLDLEQHAPVDTRSCSGDTSDPAQCQRAPLIPRIELGSGVTPLLAASNAPVLAPARRTRHVLPLVRAPSPIEAALPPGFPPSLRRPPRA